MTMDDPLTEKEILVTVFVQSILLIPLTAVNLRGLDYMRRWWSLFIDKQLALGFGIQASVVESFLRWAAACRIPVKVSVGAHFK